MLKESMAYGTLAAAVDAWHGFHGLEPSSCERAGLGEELGRPATDMEWQAARLAYREAQDRYELLRRVGE